MSESKSTQSVGHDALGILLFGLAAFLAVSVIKAMGEPVSNPNATTAMVLSMVDFLGAWPSLAMCAGLVIVGARLFISGVAGGGIVRILGTVAAVTFGLCLVLGALSSGQGGALAAGLAGTVGNVVTALLGVAVVAVPVWALWLRPPGGREKTDQEDAPSVFEASESDEGVSAVEAEALLPKELVGALARPTIPNLTAPSPYPPDVRKEGKIPEGTQPITRDDALSPEDPDPVAGLQWSPRKGHSDPEHSAGQDLATEAGAEEGDRSEQAGAEVAGRPLDPEARAATSEAVPITGAVESPVPQPSWEQSGLFVEEEPVDAYGTPESVTDALRGGAEAEAPAEEADTETVQESLSASASETPAVVDTAVEETSVEEEPVTAESEPAVAPEAEEEEEELEDEEEYEDGAEEAEYDEDEEYEEDEDAEEEEEDEDEDGVYAEDDDEAEEEDEAEEAEYEDDVEYEDEEDEEDEEYEDEAAEQEAEEEVVAEAEEEPEPVAEVAAASAPEPEVEIRPAARKRSKPAAAAKGALDPDLVARAGAMILERQRVAVSMLQREFGLDFKQATKVLDELQSAGLIGPYLGGQRRDILMTPEQWKEQAGVG